MPRIRPTPHASVLMCRPDFFTVSYRINPWMHPEDPTDTSLAVRQWDELYEIYRDARFRRAPHRPDRRVCPTWSTPPTAGFVIDGIAYGAKLHLPAAPARGSGVHAVVRATRDSRCANPGSSTRARATSCSSAIVILAGQRVPHRPSRSHEEVAADLRPRGRSRSASSTRASTTSTPPSRCWMTRTSPTSRRPSTRRPAPMLRELYPDAVVVTDEDAAVLGLNSFSDGYNVVIASRAKDFERQLARTRLQPHRRRPQRAPARRRRGQVLHPGAAAMNDARSDKPGAASEPAVSGFGGHLWAQTAGSPAALAAIELEERHLAHNYDPLPVVIARAEGAWVTDVDGRRYLDCLAAYGAMNFGHGHPALVAAAKAQLERVTLTSRAFHNDRLGPFAAALAALAGKQMVLPMNTGAEAVESAIKLARAWGYRVKGVSPERAIVIVADGNFHGRTITLVGFSSDPVARADFGPFTPGFVERAIRGRRGRRDRDRRGVRGRRRGRRRARRADPGRGRDPRAAGRLPPAGAGDHPPRRRAHDRGRDPVRTRPNRHDVRVRSRRGRARPVPRSARRSAAGSCH